MAFKQTVWEFSDETEKEDLPQEGERYLFIRNAAYDENNAKYYLYMTDIGDETQFILSYNLNKVDKNSGALMPNSRTRNTLITLNRALFDASSGIPFPDDIIGGVVQGKVVHREYNGRTYANVYSFEAVPEDIALSYSQIEQYYVGYVQE